MPLSAAAPARRAGSLRHGQELSPLGPRPAVLLHLSGLNEGITVALGDLTAVEREIEQQHLAQISASKIETGSHHADFVAHLQSVSSAQQARPLPIPRKLLAKTIY